MKKCAGPASAAAAHGVILAENCFRNRKGKIAKIAKNTRYQTTGVVAAAGSKRLKCQLNSSATAHASAMAGIQSTEKYLVIPNNRITSSKARPNTGEGFFSGRRSVSR